MKFKKIMSAALAGALALSMSATAFAASNTTVETAGGEANTVIEGTTKTATIRVTVPSTGSVIVNPYKLEVDTGATDENDEAIMSQATIINAAQFIKSESDVALNVGVSVTGAVAGNAKLASAPLTADVTTNSLYLYFQMATATIPDGATDPAEPTWAAYAEANDILVGSKAVKKDAMIQIAAQTPAAESDPAVPAYAAFHVAGEAVSAPKTPWAATDTVSVTVAFTFTPVAATPADNA